MEIAVQRIHQQRIAVQGVRVGSGRGGPIAVRHVLSRELADPRVSHDGGWAVRSVVQVVVAAKHGAFAQQHQRPAVAVVAHEHVVLGRETDSRRPRFVADRDRISIAAGDAVAEQVVPRRDLGVFRDRQRGQAGVHGQRVLDQHVRAPELDAVPPRAGHRDPPQDDVVGLEVHAVAMMPGYHDLFERHVLAVLDGNPVHCRVIAAGRAGQGDLANRQPVDRTDGPDVDSAGFVIVPRDVFDQDPVTGRRIGRLQFDPFAHQAEFEIPQDDVVIAAGASDGIAAQPVADIVPDGQVLQTQVVVRAQADAVPPFQPGAFQDRRLAGITGKRDWGVGGSRAGELDPFPVHAPADQDRRPRFGQVQRMLDGRQRLGDRPRRGVIAARADVQGRARLRTDRQAVARLQDLHAGNGQQPLRVGGGDSGLQDNRGGHVRVGPLVARPRGDHELLQTTRREIRRLIAGGRTQRDAVLQQFVGDRRAEIVPRHGPFDIQVVVVTGRAAGRRRDGRGVRSLRDRRKAEIAAKLELPPVASRIAADHDRVGTGEARPAVSAGDVRQLEAQVGGKERGRDGLALGLPVDHVVLHRVGQAQVRRLVAATLHHLGLMVHPVPDARAVVLRQMLGVRPPVLDRQIGRDRAPLRLQVGAPIRRAAAAVGRGIVGHRQARVHGGEHVGIAEPQRQHARAAHAGAMSVDPVCVHVVQPGHLVDRLQDAEFRKVHNRAGGRGRLGGAVVGVCIEPVMPRLPRIVHFDPDRVEIVGRAVVHCVPPAPALHVDHQRDGLRTVVAGRQGDRIVVGVAVEGRIPGGIVHELGEHGAAPRRRGVDADRGRSRDGLDQGRRGRVLARDEGPVLDAPADRRHGVVKRAALVRRPHEQAGRIGQLRPAVLDDEVSLDRLGIPGTGPLARALVRGGTFGQRPPALRQPRRRIQIGRGDGLGVPVDVVGLAGHGGLFLPGDKGLARAVKRLDAGQHPARLEAFDLQVSPGRSRSAGRKAISLVPPHPHTPGTRSCGTHAESPKRNANLAGRSWSYSAGPKRGADRSLHREPRDDPQTDQTSKLSS